MVDKSFYAKYTLFLFSQLTFIIWEKSGINIIQNFSSCVQWKKKGHIVRSKMRVNNESILTFGWKCTCCYDNHKTKID